MESLGMQPSLLYKEPRYIIDACSILSQKETHTHNRKIHKTLWANIETLLTEGDIIILSEVEDEIKDGADEVSTWLKTCSFRGVPLDRSIQSAACDILKTAPEIVDFNGCKSSTDIFLIAAAKKYGLTVITEENKQSPKKIPKVCEKVGVKCVNINELCSAENWSF